MIRRFVISLLLFLPGIALPDAPPDFPEYTICGDFEWFCAEILLVDNEPSTPPWNADFRIRMLDKRGDSDQVSWEQEYDHPGYRGGLVTSDGRYFVYVDQWFYEEGAAVTIIEENGIIEIPGKAFGIDENELIPTASHRLWLAQEDWEHHARLEGKRLVLQLIDGRKAIITLEDGDIRFTDID